MSLFELVLYTTVSLIKRSMKPVSYQILMNILHSIYLNHMGKKEKKTATKGGHSKNSILTH